MRDAPRTGRATRASGLTVTAVVVAAIVVAAVAGGWTSRADAGSRLWVANPYVKLQEATRPAPWKAALVAPRGGRAAFQVVLDRAPKAQPRAGVLTGPAGARLANAVSIGASSRCPSPSARAPSTRAAGRGPGSARARLGTAAAGDAAGVLGLDRHPAHAGRGDLSRLDPGRAEVARLQPARRKTSRSRASGRCTPGSSSGRATPTTPNTDPERPPPTRARYARYGIGDGSAAGGRPGHRRPAGHARGRRIRCDAAATRTRRRPHPPSACAPRGRASCRTRPCSTSRRPSSSTRWSAGARRSPPLLLGCGSS